MWFEILSKNRVSIENKQNGMKFGFSLVGYKIVMPCLETLAMTIVNDKMYHSWNGHCTTKNIPAAGTLCHGTVDWSSIK